MKRYVLRTAPALAAVLSAFALGATLHPGEAKALTPPAPSAVAAGAADERAPDGLDTAALVEKVKSSVVNITVERTSAPVSSEGASPFEFFFRHGPFGHGSPSGEAPFPMPPRRQAALGSGFLFDDRGHVLTNAHVVDHAETVRVKLADERELDAKVIGRDERLDVAVLEVVGAKDLPHATLGASSALKVGEPVVAIGNPFGLGHTVTRGIVSAKGRAIGAGPYDDFIQTDASINPGNSGGPLFDSRGQVVGMNTAINPAGQGIGFAIPSDEIREILPQLVKKGRVDRGRLGVRIQDVDTKIARAMKLPSARGALVGEVEAGSPAAAAGLQSGDIIQKAGDEEIAHARDLSRAIARHAPNAKVDLVLRRGDRLLTIPVTLGKLEAAKQEAAARGSGEAAPSSTGSLGLAVQDAEGGGALVRSVAPDGPAAGAVRPGDVIVELDRQPVRNAADLGAKARKAPSQRPILLKITRDGSAHFIAIEKG